MLCHTCCYGVIHVVIHVVIHGAIHVVIHVAIHVAIHDLIHFDVHVRHAVIQREDADAPTMFTYYDNETDKFTGGSKNLIQVGLRHGKSGRYQTHSLNIIHFLNMIPAIFLSMLLYVVSIALFNILLTLPSSRG